MSYERWVRENTSKYKGFEIRAGTIYKDGEAMVLFFAPFAATKQEVKRLAIPIIDRYIEKVKENN